MTPAAEAGDLPWTVSSPMNANPLCYFCSISPHVCSKIRAVILGSSCWTVYE